MITLGLEKPGGKALNGGSVVPRLRNLGPQAAIITLEPAFQPSPE